MNHISKHVLFICRSLHYVTANSRSYVRGEYNFNHLEEKQPEFVYHCGSSPVKQHFLCTCLITQALR